MEILSTKVCLSSCAQRGCLLTNETSGCDRSKKNRNNQQQFAGQWEDQISLTPGFHVQVPEGGKDNGSYVFS